MKPAAPVTRTFTSPPVAAGSRGRCRPGRPRCRRRSRPRRSAVAVGLVRHADDQDLGLGQHLVQRHETRIGNVRVRAQNVGAGPEQQLAQLVAERRADVVRLGLEGHAEQADRATAQAAVSLLHGADHVGGQAFVDLHRRLAEPEVVRREGRELHRVLEQARPGREPGRAGPRARVVRPDRPQNVVVVDACVMGDRRRTGSRPRT